MDWSNVARIVLAGLAAAVACGIAEAVKKSSGKRGVAYWATFLISMGILTNIGQQVIMPEIRAWEAARQAESMPIVAALRTLEPAAADQLTTLNQEAVRSGDKSGELKAKMRSTIAKAASTHGGKATDEVLFKFIGTTVASLEVLAQKDSNACFNYLYPQPGKFYDYSNLVGSEAVSRELDALGELLTSAAKQSNRVPAEEEVTPILEPVIVRMQSKFAEEDLVTFADAKQHPEKGKLMCDMSLMLFREIAALPQDKRGPLLRWMFTAGSRR